MIKYARGSHIVNSASNSRSAIQQAQPSPGPSFENKDVNNQCFEKCNLIPPWLVLDILLPSIHVIALPLASVGDKKSVSVVQAISTTEQSASIPRIADFCSHITDTEQEEKIQDDKKEKTIAQPTINENEIQFIAVVKPVAKKSQSVEEELQEEKREVEAILSDDTLLESSWDDFSTDSSSDDCSTESSSDNSFIESSSDDYSTEEDSSTEDASTEKKRRWVRKQERETEEGRKNKCRRKTE